MANTPNVMKNKNEDKSGTHDEGNAWDKAKDVASSVTEKARDVASSVAEKAGNVASKVGQKAEDATCAVGGGMKSLAETIRVHSPESGMLKSASTGVANTLESAGKYLQEEGLHGIGHDLTDLVRRNPIPAILVGVAVGYLVARATRS
jgi:hypothetical protein